MAISRHRYRVFGAHTTPTSTELSQRVRFGMLTSFFFQAEQKVEDSNRWEERQRIRGPRLPGDRTEMFWGR